MVDERDNGATVDGFVGTGGVADGGGVIGVEGILEVGDATDL
jgi:hypothetical protein